MKAGFKLLAPILLLGCAACVQRDMVMVVPAANTNVAANVSHHCFSPDDAKAHYLTPEATVRAGMVNPKRAVDEHVNGCAAVKFHVGADGKATDITVLREYPEGYGYGAAVIDSVQRSTYKPPEHDDDWFFSNTTTVFNR